MQRARGGGGGQEFTMSWSACKDNSPAVTPMIHQTTLNKFISNLLFLDIIKLALTESQFNIFLICLIIDNPTHAICTFEAVRCQRRCSVYES